MSQYLSFYLRKKDNPEIHIGIGYFCTTPAREISNLDAFPYTNERIILDYNTFTNYLTEIRNEINSIEKYLNEYLKEKSEIQENIYKCVSKEVAQMFINKLEDVTLSIESYKEELEDWEYRYNKLSFILEIYIDNKDDCELYYLNC